MALPTAQLKEFLASLKEALISSPKTVKEATVESVQGVRSTDQPTRKMAWLFIFSVIGLFFTLGYFGKYFYIQNQAEKAHLAEMARIAEEKRLQEEELKKRNLPPTYQTLGPFSLELREKPGVVRPRNSMGSAEMEIVAACDDPTVCEYLKQNIDAARGELLPLFVPTERERFLTISGKKAFRDEIRDQLNRWLTARGVEGRIVDILLPKFIMS